MWKRFAGWLDGQDPTPPFEADLFREDRVPSTERDFVFELYKLMVSSSEALVGRRQAVNTFFLTANGAILTAVGFFVGRGSQQAEWMALAIAVLTVTGAVLCFAWQSLLRSFGQLNTGKFAIINRLEREFPVAIYAAEWKALGEGENPRVYRSFTSREIWVPRCLLCVYAVATLVALIVWGCAV
ncbi:MAG: RipA family octameric membrane protein [Gammaproteobacteria bacterium]